MPRSRIIARLTLKLSLALHGLRFTSCHTCIAHVSSPIIQSSTRYILGLDCHDVCCSRTSKEELSNIVEVIHFHQKNPSISIRGLGEKFECGKTQIAYILKHKTEILSLFQNNASDSRHITGKSRTSEYAEVNEALYKWFCIACSKNIFPGGPELTEKAKEIAIKLGKPNFKGSRGWLNKWKKRFRNSKFNVVNLVMLKVQLLSHGRSAYQKLSKAMRKMTSGTWMRRGCFGEHCWTKVLV